MFEALIITIIGIYINIILNKSCVAQLLDELVL